MYDEALWLDWEGAEYEDAELEAAIEQAEYIAGCEALGIDPIAEMEGRRRGATPRGGRGYEG